MLRMNHHEYEQKPPERPRMHGIEDVIEEALDTNTYWFKGEPGAKPGQFVMLWVPGAGQKPFGISYQEKGRFAVTVRKVGPFTEELFGMKAGDRVGIQGPYGRAFSCKGKRVALVGGGYGTAPLGFLAEVMSAGGSKVFVSTGAASSRYLMFRERFRHAKIKAVFSTDDGSFGHRGFCTDCLTGLLETERIDRVYSCGPEAMLREVARICSEQGVDAEFSLERYLKCGFGVCGSCSLDGTGWRVCKEGPVFTLQELGMITEFGKYKRDGSGRRMSI
ncbi:MAG: dihydroorotate dehydrogenase electron transfer subunit [Candidatus Aenigmarchaeota archaeon]|nr:dihydroorotate dehydrogenase electron transfer subunit [Candidatus Aenigmarchaeota archaeon]